MEEKKKKKKKKKKKRQKKKEQKTKKTKKKKKKQKKEKKQKEKQHKQKASLEATWDALEALSCHCNFHQIPFLELLQINFSKGVAQQRSIVGLTPYINSIQHPPL